MKISGFLSGVLIGIFAVGPALAFGVDRMSYYEGMMTIIKKLDSIDNKLFMLVAVENKKGK
jgi:hypothetical protein